MIKGAIEDTFEKLAEQGSSTVKKTVKSSVKQVAGAISPTKMWEQLLGVDSHPSTSSHSPNSPEKGASGNKDHTPLNFDKLAKQYQNTDKQKTEALRNRLFQLVKQGEEKVLADKKQEEEEKKRKEEYELMEKKRKEEENRKQQAAGNIPQGKVRRSIFSPKKVAERSHAETKPSTGKQ